MKSYDVTAYKGFFISIHCEPDEVSPERHVAIAVVDGAAEPGADAAAVSPAMRGLISDERTFAAKYSARELTLIKARRHIDEHIAFRRSSAACLPELLRFGERRNQTVLNTGGTSHG